MGTFVPTPFTNPIIVPAAAAGDAFRRIPYISASEYRFAPTAVGTTNLVQHAETGGKTNLASLAEVIQRASGWVDEYCFHTPAGTLAASVTTEKMWVTPKPTGAFVVICNFKPVWELVGLGVGPNPAQMSSMTPSTATSISIIGKTITVPSIQISGTFPTFGPWPTMYGQLYVVWQYVNGFAHMSLATNAAKTATTIKVTPAVPATFPSGVYANTLLTIKDGAKTETVQVSATPSTNTLSLKTALKYAHTVPASPDHILVSAVPWQIEQATISLTSVLVKAQSSRALTLNQIGSLPSRVVAARAGAGEDFDNAMRLLTPFRVTYLHG